MIDLVQYRIRIGTFSQGRKSRKIFLRSSQVRSGRHYKSSFPGVPMKIAFCSILVYLVIGFANCQAQPRSIELFHCFIHSIYIQHKIFVLYTPALDIWEEYTLKGLYSQTGNFWARYTNGNGGSQPKGVKCLHLNIRSLKNKVFEIKNIIRQEKPSIFVAYEGKY